MNSTIGLVVALPSEARALIGRGRWQHAEGHLFRRSHLNNRTHLIVVRSGLGMENAFLASQWLIAEGVVALGVSGVSGGLDPGLEPGDLVLADSIIQENGNTCQQIWEGNFKFVDISYAALIAKGIPTYRGPIITVQRAVLSARNKQALFTKTNALAVDMESAAVAAVAIKASIPFFALRTVCDAATRSIPIEIFDCLNQVGNVRLFHFLRMLLIRPALVSDLLRTRINFNAALATLGRAWHTQISSNLPALLKNTNQ
ncbi:MAG: hypothetical protein H8E19_04855 [Deltaproteobacteria bacterium]|uniref:Nucleoside phosphorylase domain-containing protein n=1 Tax=Candidatus Desulfacyla euxinica TaxID=2841693 RepID=A0A8J6MWQ5_9DELT|nr:hypothetical protein [Candidatus Desulfacyla euxinica]MBL7216070.1 hypothetical protein [Desulfobacteraceae bacterium]